MSISIKCRPKSALTPYVPACFMTRLHVICRIIMFYFRSELNELLKMDETTEIRHLAPTARHVCYLFQNQACQVSNS